MNYREEIFHAAIKNPIMSKGWFEVAGDGTLIRHQTTPYVETMRIGEHFIFVNRRPDSDESNIISIPGRLAPLLMILRRVINQTEVRVPEAYTENLETDASGWKLWLTPTGKDQSEGSVVIRGCGDDMQSITFRFRNGENRRTIFGVAP